MIDLQLAVVSDLRAPFVVKLGGRALDATASGDEVAELVGEFEDRAVYARGASTFTVVGATAQALTGDVVFVDPERRALFRWLRRGSPHNTLLVTERCDQLCLMCSQPPRKTHIDLFGQLAQACRLADPDTVIGLSGGEPTLYKDQLFELLDATLRARPDLSFHILTNAQHFSADDIPRLRLWRPDQVRWGVPLYSSVPQVHDRIVAKAGAFTRLEHGLDVLLQAGAAVELRTVVLQANAAEMPALARHVASRLPFISVWAIMQLEHIGFARKRWTELYYDHAAAFAPIAGAVDTAWLNGVPVALYNFPRCSVPADYRRFAHASISDWKRRYLRACDACSERSSCSGFFEWHPIQADDRGVKPL